MGESLKQKISTDNFLNVMSTVATGVSVVTTNGPAGKFGTTVSAFSSVSAEPPMILVCINRKSPIVDAIEENEHFCVNLLNTTQKPIAATFAGRPETGAPYDFTCAEWQEGVFSTPILVDALASFECSVANSNDAGTHRIFIGSVIALESGAASPLVYADRQFKQVTDLTTIGVMR